MQGQLVTLETTSSDHSSSHEVYGAESAGCAEESVTGRSATVFATTEEAHHRVLNEKGDQQMHH